METLPKTIKICGTGLKDNHATQLEREGNVCLYKRSDIECDVYEVFIVKVQPAKVMFGKAYPEKEIYPGNEDFGKTAWCITNDRERAYKKYCKLISHPRNKQGSPQKDTSPLL